MSLCGGRTSPCTCPREQAVEGPELGIKTHRLQLCQSMIVLGKGTNPHIHLLTKGIRPPQRQDRSTSQDFHFPEHFKPFQVPGIGTSSFRSGPPLPSLLIPSKWRISPRVCYLFFSPPSHNSSLDNCICFPNFDHLCLRRWLQNLYLKPEPRSRVLESHLCSS